MEEEEITNAVKKMKLRKAAGIDEISMEAWKLGGVAMRNYMSELIRRIWREESIPKEWRLVLLSRCIKEATKKKWKIIERYLYYVQAIRYMMN